MATILTTNTVVSSCITVFTPLMFTLLHTSQPIQSTLHGMHGARMMAMFVSVTCSWLVACATTSETTQTSVESLVFDVRLCTAAVSTSSSTSSVPGAAGETTGKSDTNHTMRMSASVKWITGRCVLSVPARGAVRLSYAAESRYPSTCKTSEGE